MSYQILVTPRFQDEYAALPTNIVSRVNTKIDSLSENPDQVRFPLSGLPKELRGLHKVRVGDYRILLWVDHEREEMTLYSVGHRSTIYKWLGKN